MSFDFSGYATKFNVQCSDGRTIRDEAFKHMDGKTVPLVWQHNQNSPENVLGHALLEYRPGDGMYAYATTNSTQRGEHAKEMVRHKDIEAFSIHAVKVKQRSADVVHGQIVELSLVLSGANPGALIDNVVIQHGDSYDFNNDEVIIYGGNDLTAIDESSDEDVSHSEGSVKMEPEKQDDAASEKTVADVYKEMTDEQKRVVSYLVESALEDETDEAAPTDEPVKHSDSEGTDMTRNLFEGETPEGEIKHTLSRDDLTSIMGEAQKLGSLKEAVIKHADTYGIKDIEMLFPDAKMITSLPEFIKRRTEWVASVMDGTNHSPFSRIKSMQADITADEARAKGYMKGNRKKDEIFTLLKRVTTPTTIYKKQKLDRDDVIDITDFDVVAWVKAEMRLMLEEEIARAILIGDGRDVDDPDKINENNIRPIWKEDPLYAPRVTVTAVNGSLNDPLIEATVRSRNLYEGSGNPVLYTSSDVVTDLLLMKNEKTGERVHKTIEEVAAALRVSKIVEVPQFSGLKSEAGKLLLGIMVNLRDYTVGADRGGQTTYFEDFDIDYNQHKYLLETRGSGALTKTKSAIILEAAVVGGAPVVGG